MSWTAETNIKGPAGPPGGLGEAPTDGQTYGRQGSTASWQIVTGGGGTPATATPLVESGAGAVGTSLKYAREDHVHPLGPGGGGTAATITFTPAGNIAATNVQAALVELDNEKVAKAGDTMTGNLTINKSNPSLVLQKTAFTGQANQLAGYNGANPRWALALGDSTNEGGSSSGSDFTLYNYTDAGGPLGTPLVITRSNGNVALTGMLTLPATAPSTGNHATNKTYVDNAIAAKPGTIVSDTPPAGAPDGTMWFESDTGLTFVRYNDGNTTQWVQAPAIAQRITPVRGQLGGLTLSTAGSSATFGIAAGEAADSTNAVLMQLASAFTKTTGAWAVGNGVGALDTGAIAAAAWYHVFLIRRPDTGVVDVAVSATATPANGPTLGVNIPAAYTQFRRIGSMKTVASQWTKFIQLGDEFLWDVPVADASGTTFGTTAITPGLTVPTGVQVNALLSGLLYNAAGTYVLFTSPDQTNTVASVTAVSVYVIAANTGYSGLNIRTSTSAQIRVVASAASTLLYISTFGWIDRRGRDA